MFSRPRYLRNTAYRITNLERTGKGAMRLPLDAPLDIGRRGGECGKRYLFQFSYAARVHPFELKVVSTRFR